MKAIFYVLALLVTIGAAYFSYDSLGKFKAQQEQKLATIDANKAKTKEGDDKNDELTKELAALDEANKKKDELEASIDTLKSKERTLVSDTKKVEATLEEQKVKFAQLEEIRAKAMETLKGVDVSLEDLPAEVVKMEEDKKAKTKALAEVQALVEAAQKNVEANQAEIARLGDRDASRNSRMRRNAMESVVTAVNEDWGFVIIGAGSNTGFTPQTKLLVKRDGRLIAEVQPSAIEPSQTIAEIDRETVAAGARIQPGDRVILANPATN
ncbi:hypothetical protein OKA05_09440 [Luteolibacter arcticus]|uniref:Uncharacterized protein n=1 Tax=Luteolibacter arcticus TaxID=1581411 RepID=A0ABT3GHI8_9BACT|nr:hypothetical protein [Luteolibacter arcticus]MCW1922773.1 hypothetical protein [Luteolibacter arcticus]